LAASIAAHANRASITMNARKPATSGDGRKHIRLDEGNTAVNPSRHCERKRSNPVLALERWIASSLRSSQ
jgi:hypothetical protein